MWSIKIIDIVKLFYIIDEIENLNLWIMYCEYVRTYPPAEKEWLNHWFIFEFQRVIFYLHLLFIIFFFLYCLQNNSFKFISKICINPRRLYKLEINPQLEIIFSSSILLKIETDLNNFQYNLYFYVTSTSILTNRIVPKYHYTKIIIFWNMNMNWNFLQKFL